MPGHTIMMIRLTCITWPDQERQQERLESGMLAKAGLMPENIHQ